MDFKSFKTANVQWLQLLNDLIYTGQKTAPRGQETLELLGYQTCTSMLYPVITIPERELGYKFMAAEAAWIISGDNRVETIAPYSRKIADFSDDGEVFFGAYGPKIVAQLMHVLRSLSNDHDSRQAVINIWRENPPRTKDVPCTTTVQWLIRNGKLHCIDTMRSSDAWLGWPYDVFNFSMLSNYIAILLRQRGQQTGDADLAKLQIGNLYLTAGSQHLYDRNFVKAVEIVEKYADGKLVSELSVKQGPAFLRGDEMVQHLWDAANGEGIVKTWWGE